MKTEYRIVEKHYETASGKYITGNFYIPQYRNLWTLFVWKKIDPIYGQYESIETAEKAIEVHKGFKPITKEIKRL